MGTISFPFERLNFNLKERENFARKNWAMAELILLVETSLYSLLECCNEAKEGWNALGAALMIRTLCVRFRYWGSGSDCVSMYEYVNQRLTLRPKVKILQHALTQMRKLPTRRWIIDRMKLGRWWWVLNPRRRLGFITMMQKRLCRLIKISRIGRIGVQ